MYCNNFNINHKYAVHTYCRKLFYGRTDEVDRVIISIIVGDDVEKCANMIRPMLALYAGGMGERSPLQTASCRFVSLLWYICTDSYVHKQAIFPLPPFDLLDLWSLDDKQTDSQPPHHDPNVRYSSKIETNTFVLYFSLIVWSVFFRFTLGRWCTILGLLHPVAYHSTYNLLSCCLSRFAQCIYFLQWSRRGALMELCSCTLTIIIFDDWNSTRWVSQWNDTGSVCPNGTTQEVCVAIKRHWKCVSQWNDTARWVSQWNDTGNIHPLSAQFKKYLCSVHKNNCGLFIHSFVR